MIRRRQFLRDVLRDGPLVAGLIACRTASPAPAAWTTEPRPLPADFRRGMNFAHLHRRGYGYGSERAHKQLERLRSIGITDIALSPFAYTPRLDSARIEWGGDESMTDDDLRAQCAQAHALGMRVLMKPHLWSQSYAAGKGNPDIDLTPADWAVWFAEYTQYAVHFAALAQECGCESLCVGLEYTIASRENPGAWAAVAKACREVYKGQLIYAANWYEEWEQFTDWGAFDAVGIDAYFPLTGTTVDELTASWAPHLDRIEKSIEKTELPVIFTEAGFQSVVGSAAHPWESHDGGTPDLEGQARAYEALLRATTLRPWFRGVYWWKWFTDMPGETDPFVPAGNPAEGVLRAWFVG